MLEESLSDPDELRCATSSLSGEEYLQAGIPLSYSLLDTSSIVFRAGALSVIACLRLLHQIQSDHGSSSVSNVQVAEERRLAGLCGSAACVKVVPAAKRTGHLAGDIDILFCSPACELAARRLAGRLGNANAAINRFAAALQPLKAMSQAHPAKDTSAYAAGAADNPIMLAQVKVCSVALRQLMLLYGSIKFLGA